MRKEEFWLLVFNFIFCYLVGNEYKCKLRRKLNNNKLYVNFVCLKIRGKLLKFSRELIFIVIYRDICIRKYI